MTGGGTCDVCGAVVVDVVLHAQWHAAVLQTLRPLVYDLEERRAEATDPAEA